MYTRIKRRGKMRRIGIVILFLVLLGPLTISYSASGMVNTQTLDPVGQAMLGYCSVVSAAGNYAYAGFGSAVVVLDMQNPSNPIEKGRTYVPNCFDGKTAVWNNRFYVPRDIYGLGIFDVSDPADPYHVKTYHGDPQTDNEYSGGVEVLDGYVFWANGPKGLTILDASDPSYTVGNFDDNDSSPLDFAMGVHVVGDLAYLCTRATGVYVIKISTLSLDKIISSGWAIDMAVSDTNGYGYLADGTYGLKVINLTTNKVISSYKPFLKACYYRSIVAFGNFIYVANATSGVEVFDVSNPLKPEKINNIPTKYYSNQLAIEDDLLYVADCLGGLNIYSLTDPKVPQHLATFGQPDQSRDVAVLTENTGGQEVPRFAYIAYGKKGLAIVDVNDLARSSPETIRDINNDADKGSTEAVAINNGMLYVADGMAGLKVFSLSDPLNPQLVWPKSLLPAGFLPKNILDVQVLDNVAFLADSDSKNGGLWILDMNGMENPGFQPSVKFKHGIGYARRVFKHGDYVYVASKGSGCSGPDSMNGLHVVKLDQSMEPEDEVISLTKGYEQITDVDAADVNGKPYVFATTDGGLTGLSYLHILEHSIPEAKLVEVSKTKFNSEYIGNFLPAVEIAGTNAYVDHTNSGIYVYDIADPSSPKEKSFYKLTCNNNSYEIHLFAGLIYDAHGDSGLYIFRPVDDS